MNISSASAFYALPLMSMYAASKAFVNQFSLAFDEEMKPYGIRILTACPGMVDTHFRERAGGSKKKKDDPMIMTAEHVAEKIWKQIVDKKELKVIDWKYSFMKLFSNLFPRSWLSALLKKNILERIEPRPFIKISHESRKPK